jgi:hypothetical protein
MGLKLLKRKVERCNTLGMPRARRRCAVRIGRASSDCEPATGADRLGYELRGRCPTRLPPYASSKGGVCREPNRSRHAVRDLGIRAMGTILVGMATPQQFEAALAAVQKGPLPPAALERLTALRQGFDGEPR